MSRGSNSAGQIAVFAKAPVPGLAKTRLIPRLGPDGTADLQRRLTENAVATALKAGMGRVSLWCAPDCEHGSFRRFERDHGISLYQQAGHDLGARMLAAFQALTDAGPVLLIGTDCPALTAAHLRQAAKVIAARDAVFIPAEDGGYVLVGLHRPEPALFEGVSWGTSAVMAQTRERVAQLRLQSSEPLTLWDVDLPEDLDRLRALGWAV